MVILYFYFKDINKLKKNKIMSNVKTVKGDIFIIPNEAFKLDSLCPDSVRNTIIKRTQRLIGLKLSGSEIMAEVWITSPECDNWSSTYGGLQKHLGIELKDWNERDEDSYLVGYFPKLLPLDILENKKRRRHYNIEVPGVWSKHRTHMQTEKLQVRTIWKFRRCT